MHICLIWSYHWLQTSYVCPKQLVVPLPLIIATVGWSPHALPWSMHAIKSFCCSIVFNDFSSYSSVSSMLSQLNWQSLENRRINAIITMFYKVINNLFYSIKSALTRSPSYTVSSNRCCNQRFISLPARMNSYYYSFLPHSIHLWNSLATCKPDYSAPDLNSFCHVLYNYRH